MTPMQLLPQSAVQPDISGVAGEVKHYKPLDGMTLEAMAAARMHHGKDGRFVNPLANGHYRRNLGRVLRWKLFHGNEFEQHLDEQPVTPVSVDWDRIEADPGTSVTFIKHATVLIKDEGMYFIVDPLFRDLFWLIKDFTPLAFDAAQIPKVDHILITHGHYDHINKPSLAAFAPSTHVITPLGYDAIFNDLGMRRRTQLDWFETFSDGRREITLLPCNHWTMRNPFAGANRSLWGSYLFKTASGKAIFISGDTGFFDGFHEIGQRFDIDLAIMNLGAYEPRWFMAPSHMNPRETVTAFKQLGAAKLMVVHWGTFRLGDEPVHFPPLDLAEALADEGLSDRWVNLKHGQTHFMV